MSEKEIALIEIDNNELQCAEEAFLTIDEYEIIINHYLFDNAEINPIDRLILRAIFRKINYFSLVGRDLLFKVDILNTKNLPKWVVYQVSHAIDKIDNCIDMIDYFLKKILEEMDYDILTTIYCKYAGLIKNICFPDTKNNGMD